MKKLTIDTNLCVLCGVCEEDRYKEVFTRDESGKITVCNHGLIDLNKHPEIEDAISICPTGALSVEEEEILADDKESAIVRLNDLIFRELRKYPFEVSDTEYEYETGVYKAAPIPVCSHSTKTYSDDDKAEDAGLVEFERVVWSQRKQVALQYITAYKVKKLKKFFTNEESPDNFYHQKNRDISSLLNKVHCLAEIVTDGEISLPEDFCEFNVLLDWNGEAENDRYAYEWIEDYQFNYEESTWFHNAEYYRTYIDTKGEDRCWYDLTKAEAEFRDDMDYVVQQVIEEMAKGRVESVTQRYFAKARKVLNGKLDVLQKELKQYIKADAQSVFESEMQSVYRKIKSTPMPAVVTPKANIDLNYNSDYRFYSESSCDEAARNRRERAYDEGRAFVRNLPYSISVAWSAQMGQLLTEWKHMVLQAYDISGKAYPKQSSAFPYSFGNNSLRFGIIGTKGPQIEIRDNKIYIYILGKL